MFSSYLLLMFPAALCILPVIGESTASNPLQRLLSSLECYKFKQAGCNDNYFLDHSDFSNCSRAAYNGTEKAATRFYLFTNETQNDPELLHECGGEPPKNTSLDPSNPVLILFPGFVSGFCHMAVYREMIFENFKCSNRNIIGVEWTWGNSLDLVTAKENMKIVAQQVAIVIRKLKVRFKELTTESFTCMGHSLGAHGCGLVGQLENISAIHGLDPAGVAYSEEMPIDERLDPTDATHVQVTHCNAGQCLFVKEPEYILPQTYFGVNFTCGTSDVWYNDGKHQWSCYRQIIDSLVKGDILYGIVSLYPAACHHLECLYYYKTSMCPRKECNYVGVECKNPLKKESESENPTTENPVTVNPVDVNPLVRNLLGGNSQGQRNICGENCGGCTIVGANFNENHSSDKYKEYCLNTTACCDYCDEETYAKVTEECCSNNGGTSATATGEAGVCNTQ